jgi:hypothetical protein
MLALLVVAASLFAFASVAAPAFASDTYLEVGGFGLPETGSGPGQFNEPRRADVYDSAHELYVADQNNNRVQVFSLSGTSGSYLTEFGSGITTTPFGVAIDQSSGAVYVSSNGANKIVKFTRTPGTPPTFAPDPTFVSPAKGTAEGQIGSFASPLAVDPTDGTLWVADTSRKIVQHFDASGAFLGSFDGSTSPFGAFGLPTTKKLQDLAIDSAGNVVVASGPFETHVESFSPAGGYQFTLEGTFVGSSQPVGVVVGVEPGTDRILAGTTVNPQPPMIKLHEGTAALAQFGPLPAAFRGLGGLAFDAGTGYLYAIASTSFGSKGIRVLRPATRPALTVDPASNIQARSAHLSGTVNPQGFDSKWSFEFSVNNGASWFLGDVLQDVGSGSSPVPVETDLTGLDSAANYKFRLTASSSEGIKTIEGGAFATPAGPPGVEVLAAAPVTPDEARMNARVNPFGLASTYHFEYGADTSYGQSVPIPEAEAGSGTESLLVSHTLTGLAPETTIHYRLVATNSEGTTFGQDRTLTTRNEESGPPTRGIELVNNPDKGNEAASGFVSPDGSKVLWSTLSGAPGGSVGVSNPFLATRSSDGWHSQSLLPPNDQLAGQGDLFYRFSTTSDFEHFLYAATEGILSSNPRTLVRLDTSGNHEALYTVQPGAGTQALQVSDDLSHVYANSREHLDPGAPTNADSIYDFGSGEPVLVSRIPGGEPAPCGVPFSSSFGGFGANKYAWVSKAPGSPARVFFESAGNEKGCTLTSPRQLYMYDESNETSTLISGPVLPNSSEGQSVFLRANPDGSQVIYATPRRLTPDDLNSNGNDFYRYTVGQGNECLTCTAPGANVPTSGNFTRQVAISQDLTHVFFLSSTQLVPGQGKAGVRNLYVWHDGKIEYIARYSTSGNPVDEEEMSGMTPDGKVFYFLSDQAGITSDDNGGTKQVYRWAQADGSLECVTCPPGRKPTSALILVGGNQMVTEDGDSYVFRTPEAIDPLDVNNGEDIYEWRNGRIKLVTDGVSEYPSTGGFSAGGNLKLLAIGSDGANVLFAAGVNFTGYERDNSTQLYAAHVGGGFPRPPTPPAPCAEDACQGPLVAPPPLANAGSADFVGPPNPVASKPRHRRHRQHRSKRRTHRRHSKSSAANQTRKGAH